MANDRIYLQCVFCGEGTMLWKFYPFGGELAGGYMGEADRIDTFVRTHLDKCHPHSHSNHLQGQSGFIVITESPDAKTDILDALVNAITKEKQDE